MSTGSALPPALGCFRHNDGGLYQFLDNGRDSRDGSPVVIYKHLWPFEQGMWSRPQAEWASRFTPISEAEVLTAMQGDRVALQQSITASRNARKGLSG